MKLSSAGLERWQFWTVPSQPGARLQSRSLYWQWPTRSRQASLQVPPPSLTVWPSAGSEGEPPLHAGHRFFYGCPWKMNESSEVNKAGFYKCFLRRPLPHLQGVSVHILFFLFAYSTLLYLDNLLFCFLRVFSSVIWTFFSSGKVKMCMRNVVYV